MINNVCNVLPTDWSTTHARELLQSSLNISAVKVSGLISKVLSHSFICTALLVSHSDGHFK